MKYSAPSILSVGISFFPKYDWLALLIFIVIDIVIILLLSYIVEMILESYEPIDTEDH
jgi:hypothetical protein